jgi:hypothetical protein
LESGVQITNGVTGATAFDGTLLSGYNSDFLINNQEAGNIKFLTSNTEKMRITSNGLVGIGTTAPGSSLQVSNINSDSILLLENPTTLAAGIKSAMWFKTGQYFTGGIQTIGASVNTSRMGFFTYAGTGRPSLQERMSILDNGNVGIGTINPNTMLHLESHTGMVPTTMLYVDDTANAGVVDDVLIHNKYGIGTPLTIFQEGQGQGAYFYKNYPTSTQSAVKIEGYISPSTPVLQVLSYFGGVSLYVAGKARIADGTETAGAVLTSDANGLAHWDTTVLNPKVGFSLRNSQSTTLSNTGTNSYYVKYSTTDFADGVSYNSTNGYITIASSGLYHFDIDETFWSNAATEAYLDLYNGNTNNSLHGVYTFTDGVTNHYVTLHLSFDVKLNAGDHVTPRISNQGGTSIITPLIGSCSFSGHKVY